MNTIRKIVIPYFPKAIKVSSPVIFVAGIYLFTTAHPIWASILILLGIIVLTTNYITTINLQDKIYVDYLHLLGLKFNKESKTFREAIKIVISKGNYSQTINTRVQSRQLDWTDYTATLILDSDTLDLLTRNDKKKLLEELKEFSDFLNVGVEDRTTPQPFWIDMKRY
jgi:hypothetical protein